MFSVFVYGYFINITVILIRIAGVTTQALQPQTGSNFFQGLTEQTANNMNMASMFPNCPMLNNMMPGNPVSSGSDQIPRGIGSSLPKPAFSGMSNRNRPRMLLDTGASPISANGGIGFSGPAFGINIQSQPSNFMVPSGCKCGVTFNAKGCPVCNCKEHKNTGTSSTSPKSTVLSTKMAIRRSTIPDNSTTPYSTHERSPDTVKPRSPLTTALTHTSNPKVMKFTLNNISTSKPIVEATQSSNYAKNHSVNGLSIRTTSSAHALSSMWSQKVEAENDLVNEKSFPGVVALTVAVVLLFIISIILFVLWRKSRKELKREQNEMYFVEKSFRQQSLSSEDESLKTADDIIYSLIGRRVAPDLPMRSPPLTPSAPPPSASPTGKTVFKIPPDDLRHDYLELI